MELNKRFLEAYRHYQDEPRVERLKTNVMKYNRAVRDLGLRDHQVSNIFFFLQYCIYATCQVPRAKPASWRTLGLLGYRLGLLIIWSILALPGVVLNAPIFILASIISRKKQKGPLIGMP